MTMHKKGQLAIMMNFLFVVIFVILIAAVFMPMGVRFNTQMYAAGESIMLEANDSVSQIQNADVRNSLYDMFSTSLASQMNNIEVNNAIFQYSWIFVLILGALVAFLQTRKLVEYGAFV